MHPCDMRDWMEHTKISVMNRPMNQNIPNIWTTLDDTLINQKSEIFMPLKVLLIFHLIFLLEFNSFYNNPTPISIDTQFLFILFIQR